MPELSPTIAPPNLPPTDGEQEESQASAQQREWKLRKRACALQERELDVKDRQYQSDLKLRQQQLNDDKEFKERELKLKESETADRLREQRAFWNLVGKASAPVIPIILALIPPTFAFVTFVNTSAVTEKQKRDAAQTAMRSNSATAIWESRRAFAAKQEAAYQQALTTAGIFLTTPPASPKFKAARAEFERLYWAQLPLVEDNHVEAAMIELREALEMRPIDTETLKQKALALSSAVRDSLGETNAAVNAAVANIPVAPDKVSPPLTPAKVTPPSSP